MPDLFEADRPEKPSPSRRPLADRLRPSTLSEVVGQEHLTGEDGALTRMIRSGSLGSSRRNDRPSMLVAPACSPPSTTSPSFARSRTVTSTTLARS